MKKALFLMGAVAAVCAGAASQIVSTQSLAPVRPTTETQVSSLRSDDRERGHAFADT